MKFKKALIINIDSSTLGEKFIKTLKKYSTKTVFVPKDSPLVKKELSDTDCIMVYIQGVGKTEIDLAPDLKYIGCLSVAFGKVDTAYARKKNIVVTNLKGYSTESVAEFVIAAILEVLRQLEEGKKRGRGGNYSEAGISAIEIKDKAFGVVGLGSIGGRVAELARGFGAKVNYWSRRRKKDAEKKGIHFTNFATLLKNADFLSINTALAKETEGIFDKKAFQLIKKGAIVVNTAPMELVDINALEGRLKKDDMTFILDHSDEMTVADLKKLSRYKNCIIYPPIAYVSKEAVENKKRIFTSNIEAFLKGKPVNVVN